MPTPSRNKFRRLLPNVQTTRESTMPILRRVRDLLSANLHDVVEQLEDPDRMLRHAVREMEATLHSATSAAARSLAAERLIDQEFDKQQANSERARRRAERAMQAGDEPAARTALQQKCSVDRQLEALEQDRQRAHASNAQLRQRIAQMQEKLAETRQIAASTTARQRVAEARRQFTKAASAGSTGYDVVSRFERLRARIAGAEAEADAWVELTEPFSEAADRSFEERQDAVAIERTLSELRDAVARNEVRQGRE